MRKLGKFVVLEGVDGSGKSTIIKEIAKQLTEDGFDVLTIREPGSTLVGEEIRNILLYNKESLTDRTISLLFAAARNQLLETVIIPAIEQGKIVLCDRFLLSSIVYQSYGLGIDREEILELNRFALRDLDYEFTTFLLDISRDTMEERRYSRGDSDRFEDKDGVFFEKIYTGYQKEADLDSRIVKVFADRTVEKVSSEICDYIKHNIM